MGHNRTSDSKVIVVWICSELQFSITSALIYYGIQSDIQVKSYCRLTFLRGSVFNFERLDILQGSIGLPSQNLFSFEFVRASVFNYERLDILRDSIGHPSQKLLSFEFAQSFCFQLRASRYITILYRTSESKVIVVWLFLELPFSISSVSISYRARSDIRVKSYCC